MFFLHDAVHGNKNDGSEDMEQQAECSLDEGSEASGECLQRKGYVVDTSSFVTVSQVYVAQVESLRDSFPSFDDKKNGGEESTSIGAVGAGSNVIKSSKRVAPAKYSIHHPLFENSTTAMSTTSKQNVVASSSSSHSSNLEYNSLVSEDEVVLVDAIRKPGISNSISRAFHRAGPRKLLHFDPSKVNAAIVTCGGLCPGLNNVIRELVHSLYYLYGANQVWGVRGGFHGFHAKNRQEDAVIGNPNSPILLTNALVENIHHEGGTVLRSSRGGFDINEIIRFLQDKDIKHLYIIGGDGTHRGAYAIHQECRARGLNVAIAGIPKTIVRVIVVLFCTLYLELHV
jgi:6-phosphofructokinase 1